MVALYVSISGASIPDLLWSMRIKHAQTLTHYLQEVSAAVSLRSVSAVAQANIKTRSEAFDSIIASLAAQG